MTHLTFEQISELAETRALRADARDHLDSCAECRATFDRVRRLLDSAQVLPREVAPPADVWSALQARVKATPQRAARGWSWNRGWLAAAAAVVLFVGGALLLPWSLGTGKGKGAVVQRATPPAAAASPAVVAVERNYEPTLADLRRTLDEQRAALAPTTIRVVERSLAVIDSAIVEARAALAADPANRALIQILSAHYERKVDLLQRATELPSS